MLFGVRGEIAQQILEQGRGHLRSVERTRPGLVRVAAADQDDIGICGAIRELQAARQPGVDGGIGIDADLRAGLGEM